jgi:hypothetical protein
MIRKKLFSGIFSQILKEYRKRLYNKQTIHPRRDWFIGTLAFSVLVFFGGIYALITFMSYQNLETIHNQPDSSVEVLKENSAQKVLQKYRERKALFASERSGEIVPTDLPVPIEDTAATSASDFIADERAIEEVATDTVESTATRADEEVVSTSTTLIFQ